MLVDSAFMLVDFTVFGHHVGRGFMYLGFIWVDCIVFELYVARALAELSLEALLSPVKPS